VNLRLLRVLVPLGVYIAGLSACGLFSSRHNQPNDWNAEVSVEVESHNTSDIVVYLMNGSQSTGRAYDLTDANYHDDLLRAWTARRVGTLSFTTDWMRAIPVDEHAPG
jgi:hypothetical protein